MIFNQAIHRKLFQNQLSLSSRSNAFGEGSLGKAMTGTESGKLMNPFAEGGLGRAYEGAGAAIGLDLSKGEEELVYSPVHQPDQGPIHSSGEGAQ